MKTKSVKFSGIILIVILSLNCNSKRIYKQDGVFEGKSQANYKDEPYVGISKITIENGKISKIDFQIIDTSKNEVFDEKYEKHFIGNELYINQCRNDWKGVQNYPKKLVEKQIIDSVDAVSGATWSYNIFKSSVKVALNENVKK